MSFEDLERSSDEILSLLLSLFVLLGFDLCPSFVYFFF
jgi:hypothetical protein